MSELAPESSAIVLFVPHSNASFSEMLHIALAINDRGQYKALFLIHWADHQQSVAVCRGNGIAYRLYGSWGREDKRPERVAKEENTKDISSSQNAQASKQPTIFSKPWLKAKIVSNFFAQFSLYLFRFFRDKRKVKNLITEISPVCLLLMGDRHVGVETALVHFSNQLGVPSMIVPFALSDQYGALIYRQAMTSWRRIYGMESWLNRFIARIKPGWVYTHGDVSLLWNPPAWMLAAEIMNIMPSTPWTLGGGRSWLMAVENEYNIDSFLQQGTPSSKIVVSGKPRYDLAAITWLGRQIIRPQICEALGLEKDKSLLVCAVPQSAEHGFLPWAEHWRETEFLFDSFSQLKPDVNVVLSLHPRSDYDQYAPRAKKYGLVIAREHGYDQLIPVCDGLVATYSSTVTLAIATHTPTIVVDFLNFNYDFFDDVTGTIVVRQHAQFLTTLKRLFSDQDYYNQLVEGQAQAAKIWARFDGKATERILDLIDELVERGKEIQKLPKRERRRALPPWSQ